MTRPRAPEKPPRQGGVYKATVRGKVQYRAVATAIGLNGQRHYRQAYRRRKADAYKVLDALLAEVDALASGRAIPSRMRFAEYAVLWLEDRRGEGMAHSTLTGYGSILAEHLVEYFGPMWIDDIRPADVRKYLRERPKTHRLGPQTMTNHLRLLRVIAADAHADGLCEKQFTLRVRAPKVPKKYTDEQPGLFEAQQLGLVLPHLAVRWRAAVVIEVFTGLRWSEFSATRWTDYKSERSVLLIRRAQTRGHVGPTKNDGSVRVVPLAPWVKQVLDEHYKREMVNQHAGLRNGWIFASKYGTPYKGWPLGKPLSAAIKAAGLDRKVTPHGLRRTFATLMSDVADDETIMAICGWVTKDMLRHYRKIGETRKAAAVAQVVSLVPGIGDDDE